MEGRKIPNPLAGPPPVAEAIPIPPSPVRLSPPQLAMSAAAQAVMEATRQKKRRRKKHTEQVEVAVAPSPSPGPPATPEPKTESLVLLAAETLPSEAMEAAAAARRRWEERKRKKHDENQAAAAASPLVEQVEEAGKKEKKKKRKHGEAAASLSQSAVAGAPILEGEDNAAAAEAPAKGRKKRRRMKEQEQSGQPPLPSIIHPQVGEEAADGAKCVTVRKSSSRKKPRVLSDHEIIRMRIEARKQQPLPEGLLDAMAMAANPCPSSIEQNPNHSSPFGAFFDQFCYKPDRQQDRNALPLPRTPDRPARPPSRGHPSSESSQVTANRTCKAAKTTKTSNAERPGSAPSSGSPEKGQAKEKGRPEKKMVRKKKPRKPPPLLSTAEKRSDKYRRLPLDQLVPPPRSPHKLLQEKYASDPWKVIVICMLLNLTQGKQVRKKVKGFFRRYPDPQTAYRADPGKMAEYLAPLGLQRVKGNRIQRFSKAYVETEWTYITELCGVGKYAADAYAIFCAGRATEVVPEDHKLVDYWKYVCFELPLIQESQKAQAAEAIEVEKFVPKLQELAVCC